MIYNGFMGWSPSKLDLDILFSTGLMWDTQQIYQSRYED